MLAGSINNKLMVASHEKQTLDNEELPLNGIPKNNLLYRFTWDVT
jgi:hypothetical protein